ncbi:MAG: serine hydroxymethyltransferase [Candidatus Jordarchaeum sp.]|uniref:serine hydroxymethyltransferase n=1 Tax=Candidatus Jordarchaeum sp. TaxID=2823881 RepID=UPI00404A8630
MKSELQRTLDIVAKQNTWRREECVNLIASENIMSPLAIEVFNSDMMHRYAEGLPCKRYYQGTKYVDEIETLVTELGKKLFHCKYFDSRPISGSVANLCVFTALAQPGDQISNLRVADGGHISHSALGAAGIRGLKTLNMPFDHKEMNIDVEKLKSLIKKKKIKLIVLGGSLYLFPHPIKEIKEILEDAKILYDASHVLGLITGKRFQDPLAEGADVVATSSHKTFPGPQGGMVYTDNEEISKKVAQAILPGIVSNHHLYRLPSLAITMIETLEFGEKYADQIQKNSKKLASSLYEKGFQVLCEHKGFTESHQVAVDVRGNGGGKKVAETLEKANIICNKNLLPWDKDEDTENPSGLRLGVQECTRTGMKESEMEHIAHLITRLIIKGENPDKIKEELIQFKKDYRETKYCFTKNRIN